jgi:hypothetical protein
MFQHACLVGLADRYGLAVVHPSHPIRLAAASYIYVEGWVWA